jgi:hypothetical protein
MPTQKLELRGSGVASLRERLLGICRSQGWPLLEPLPVTRFLGDSFGISNVSAFRVLNELSDAGHLWRAPNGRYFLPGARRLLERPAPVACLLRRLERWTEVGREIMLGVDDACGELERAMLLAHDRVLFRQADPNAPTSIGPDEELRQTMEDFLRVHSGQIEGMILDELWPDRVLAKFKKAIRSGVVVYRHTKLRFLGCVSADVDGAARIAVDHARRKNFEKLVILCPSAYQPSEEMVHALEAASKGFFAKTPVVRVDSPAAHKALIAALHKERRRTLLVATEDNAAVAALDALLQAGIAVPERVGLMSTMGSRIVTDRSITAAGFDFRLMGAKAAHMAVAGTLQHIQLSAAFFPGATT